MSQRVLMSMAMAAALAVGCVAPAAAQVPVRVGGDIKEPRRIHDVKPVYPDIAQQAGVQGIVIIEAIIGTDGAVESARVLRPVPLLDQAALDAVTQWRYSPTLLNGQPVNVVMTVTVTFSLNGQQAAREVNPDPLVMQRPADDVAALLDYAKALQAARTARRDRKNPGACAGRGAGRARTRRRASRRRAPQMPARPCASAVPSKSRRC